MEEKISNDKWILRIDTDGGRIVSLERDGQQILGTFQRIDGKKGNTHVCVPNFGEEGVKDYNLPFHGPARNGEWVLVEKTENKIKISYEFKATEKYLSNLLIEQEFSLENGFRHKVTVKNIGNKDVPVNVAIHNYFVVNNGWLGLKINDVDVIQVVENDDCFDIGSENIILFTDGRKVNFNLSGFNNVRLWTARKGDENTVYDQEYVCIEPAIGKGDYFGSEESILKVGEIREVKQELF
jgi:galactose mutarotase-like enzyme